MSNLKGAACAGANPEIFFPEEPTCDEPEERARYAEDAAPAMLLCEDCPVRQKCLIGALTRGEEFGIWGGTTPRGRRQVLVSLGTPQTLKLLGGGEG